LVLFVVLVVKKEKGEGRVLWWKDVCDEMVLYEGKNGRVGS